jgi:hypothetical protein
MPIIIIFTIKRIHLLIQLTLSVHGSLEVFLLHRANLEHCILSYDAAPWQQSTTLPDAVSSLLVFPKLAVYHRLGDPILQHDNHFLILFPGNGTKKSVQKR